MKFFEPTEKRTTIAVYIFLVGVFALFCILVGANIGVIGTLWDTFLEIIRPFIYGFAIAFTLHAPVRFVENKVLGSVKMKGKLRHALSVVIVYIFIVLIILFLVLTVVPEIVTNFDDFRLKIDEFVVNFQNRTAELLSSSNNDSVTVYFDIEPSLRNGPSDRLFSFTLRNYEGIGIAVKDNSIREEVKDMFNRVVAAVGDMLGNALPDIFSSALTVLTETKNLVIGVIISLYFLLGERKHRQYLSHMGNVWLPQKIYNGIIWLIDKSKNIFRDYIVVRILDGSIIAFLTLVCLFVFQTPFSMILSFVMGIGTFFPFIGPIISIALGAIIMMIIDIRYMLVFIVVGVLLHILDSRYIDPMLHAGRDTHKLSGVWVFAAIVIMGGFFGIIGILIGIPTFAFIYSIVKELVEQRLKSKGLATETAAWYRDSVRGENVATAEIPDIEEGTDIKSFFEDRDENEAYKHMRRRIRRASRRMRPFLAKIRAFFSSVWGKIVIVLKVILSFFKRIWQSVSAPFRNLKKKFKNNNKKR